jgi:hypothetical protein
VHEVHDFFGTVIEAVAEGLNGGASPTPRRRRLLLLYLALLAVGVGLLLLPIILS